MRRAHICERADHRVLAARHTLFEVIEHRLHRVSLQAVLTAAQIARDDGKAHRGGELFQVRLGAKGQRAQHHEVALVIDELGRHGGKPAAVEQVHEEGFERVFTMMTKHQR